MKRLLAALPLAWLLVFVAPAPLFAQATPPFAATVVSRANLRSGPGVTYSIVGGAYAGQTVQVAECNSDCSWYKLDSGQWIIAYLVEPLADAAPTSTPVPSSSTATPAPLTLVGWNVESGGALQNVVADRLAAFDGVDIWGLAEVGAIDAEAYEFGAEDGEGANFDALLGTSGGGDRLLLIWDGERFERVDSGEMLGVGETGRAPLWVQLRERSGGLEFIVMVNHLHRSNDNIRYRQAQALNAWGAAQTLPVIAIGDYNFDWTLPTGVSHDAGYDLMTANGVWEWVRPAELVTTQCTEWPCRYNSILDFVFVAGPAREWQAKAEIVVAENDFPDDLTTPDHRPVLAVLSAGAQVSLPVPTANRTANLRGGPGTNYPIVGSVAAGQALQIVGRTPASDWYQLASGAWIFSDLVDGAPADLPGVTPTSTPTLIPLPGDTRGGGPVAEPEPPTPTLVPPPPGSASVIIQSIYYDGAVPQVESDEYAVIANTGTASQDLAGWRLNADDGGQDFYFPSYTLAAGQSCRVYTNEMHPETCGFSFSSSEALWANKGECGHLYDAGGAEVSSWCY